MSRALVLGLGGVTRSPWQAGVVDGLRGAGADLDAADVLVGTAGGALFAALLAHGAGLAEAATEFARIDGRLRASGVVPAVYEPVLAILGDASLPIDERRRRVGRLAERVDLTGTEAGLDALVALLPSARWPQRQLLITATDAATGQRAVLDRDSGVSLDQAVRAACSVPGLAGPTPIGRHRYMDGGIFSPTNADLAAGHDRILVIAPLPELAPASAEPERLGTSTVQTIRADEATSELFALTSFDPDVPNRTYDQGLRQAADLADQIRNHWNG